MAAAAGEINARAEHDEADHGVASRLREHGDFFRRFTAQRTGGRGFGSVIDRQAGPKAVGLIAHAELPRDHRIGEQADCAEGQIAAMA